MAGKIPYKPTHKNTESYSKHAVASRRTQKENAAIRLCFILAILAGAVYSLTALGVIGVPALSREEAPPGIALVAAGCYMVGGFLILARRLWLWIIGAAINILVIAMFFLMYSRNVNVIFSLPGMATKALQIVLEAGLLYLIVSNRRTYNV